MNFPQTNRVTRLFGDSIQINDTPLFQRVLEAQANQAAFEARERERAAARTDDRLKGALAGVVVSLFIFATVAALWT